MCTVRPHLTDNNLIRTPHYYGQFALSLGKESPCIFTKFSLKYHTSPPPNLWGRTGGGGGGGLSPMASWGVKTYDISDYSKFNPHYSDTPLKRTLSMVLSVSVFTKSTVFSVHCRMLRHLSFTITSLTHNYNIRFLKCSLHGWLYRMILPPLFRVQYFTCGLQEPALYRVGKFGDQRSNKPLWTLDHYRLLVAMCCC